MLRQHGKQIENYFKNNNFKGIKFNFIYEKEVKGTAGALSLIKKLKYDNYIIMNGDIISTINYTNLLKNHLKNNAEITVAVKRKNIEIPYGVLQLKKNKVNNIQEKPKKYYYINSGIYIVNKKVIEKVPKTGQYSMVDLMHRLLEENVEINSFPLHEYWLDVGEHHNFEKAQKDIEKLF
jgi:NDP-sugar pyrophosphorylase family protein